MKKCLAIAACIVVLAFTFSSCSQCNKTHTETTGTTADSLKVPGIEAVTAQIKADSLNPMLYYKRAQLYTAGNDFKSAATDMYLALMLDSLRPEFYLYSAEIFLKMGDAQRGIALMDKAIIVDSNNTDFYVKAAKLAFIDTNLRGHYRTSLDYLNRAIGKNMQNADIYFFKGTVYKEMGDTAKAISSFQTATELNPKFYDAYVQIGLLLQNKKDKNAEKYLDNAIKVSDKPEDALYAKANILKEQGMALYDRNQIAAANEKLTLALENFKKVIELNHRNTEAYMGAAKCYVEMDSTEQAYNYYKMATQIEPTYAGAYFSQGLCAERMGRTREAINLYQTCLNIDPDFERAQTHLKDLQKAP